MPLTNASGGAISDAQAHALEVGTLRADVLRAWAGEHVQPSLSAHLFAEPFIVGPWGVALAQGTAIHTPDCDIFPTRLVVYAPSPTLQADITAHHELVQSGDVPIRSDWTGPCMVTGTTRARRVVTIQVISAFSVIVEGSLRNDPVLGNVFFTDGSAACQGDPIAADLCSQSRPTRQVLNNAQRPFSVRARLLA